MLDISRRQEIQPVPYRGWNLANLNAFNTFFSEFDRLWAELTGPFTESSNWAAAYPINLYETGDSVVLEMAVPGLRREDLEVSLEGNQLTIRGNYPAPPKDEERRYWAQGIPQGSFSRTVNLPAAIQADGVKATVSDGLLTLTLPKVEGARVRKIAIANS